MILRVLLQLTKKQQIAGKSDVDAAAYRVGVEGEEGVRVGELGKSAAFGRRVRAGCDAEEIQAERRFWVVVLGDRDERRKSVGCRLGGEPAVVMLDQRFAVGEAEQSGAVIDFGRKLVVGQRGFLFGEGDEPGAEGGAIFGGVEAEGVGKTIAEGVDVCGKVADVDGVTVIAPGEVEPGVARLLRVRSVCWMKRTPGEADSMEMLSSERPLRRMIVVTVCVRPSAGRSMVFRGVRS
jgi:hypothetical protein